MSARITVIGNVASTPIARHTGSGRAVTNFRVGSTDRHLDRESGKWVDGQRFFVSVACWGALAENVATSLRVGSPVILTGRIAQRTWTDNDQQTRFYYEITADTVAPDLSRGTALFTKVSRSLGRAVDVDEDGMPIVGEPDTEYDVVAEHRSGTGGHPSDLVDEPAARERS